MKKCIPWSCVGLFIFFCGLSSAYALPGGYEDNGKNYLEGSSDLSRWSLGIYTDGRNRDVRIDNMVYRLDMDQVMGYVGYDLASPVTLYFTGGSSQYSIPEPPVNSSAAVYGLGLKVNLLDHEIMDPTLFEDQLRLNLQVQYTMSSLEWAGDTKDCAELSASLTLGLVNDIMGNALYAPNGIGIFAGVVYSSYLSGDVAEETQAGYTVGLEVYYTEKITLEIRMESFDDSKFLGGIHLRL
jgi:opacity protein-like surface antigen